LPEIINASQFLVPRLTREQLRMAIIEPARVMGGSIESNLVHQLLRDICHNSDQLPQLQHCLMRMWSHAKGNEPQTPQQNSVKITLKNYESVGGLENAISNHAENIFQSFSPQQQVVAERVFRFLIKPGYEREEDIRHPATFNDIVAATESSEQDVKEVINQFRLSDFCFLRPYRGELSDNSEIDISHESLIRQWKTLTTWAEKETRSAQIYRRLVELELYKKEGGWIKPPQLDIMLEWQVEQHPNKKWAERYGGNFERTMTFLAASKKVQEEKRQREEQQRQEELQRIRRQLTWVAIGLIIALMLAGWALWERSKAEKARAETKQALIVAEERREEAEEQKLRALGAEKKAKEAQKEAELNSSRFREMVTATFGFLWESRQNKEFFGWVEETLTTERLIPALNVMIDLSESLDEEQKEYWKSELSAMTEVEKVSLLDIFGKEAAKEVRRVFRIRQVTIKDANGATVPLINKICVIKPQEKMTIEIDVDNPYNQSYEVEYTASRGTVEPDATYVAPNTPGGSDIVTIEAVDIETGEIMAQESIIIQISSE
jgi:hypothetical protein